MRWNSETWRNHIKKLNASKRLSLLGIRSGRLTVIEFAGTARTNGSVNTMWTCLCECGNKLIVKGGDIRSKNKKSCGCLNKENRKTMGQRNLSKRITHGMHGTDTYAIWSAMRKRCYCKSSTAYRYYGKLGVAVCERWNDFKNFLNDMGERPDGKTLDRIDPFGNYEPSNCRWATLQEQAANKRIHKIRPVPKGHKFCPSCESIKPIDAFSIDNHIPGAIKRRGWCKPCCSKKYHEKRQGNREQISMEEKL